MMVVKMQGVIDFVTKVCRLTSTGTICTNKARQCGKGKELSKNA